MNKMTTDLLKLMRSVYESLDKNMSDSAQRWMRKEGNFDKDVLIFVEGFKSADTIVRKTMMNFQLKLEQEINE